MTFRTTIQNPSLALAKDLPTSLITPRNYCTSARGIFDDTSPQQMHDAISAYGTVCKDKGLALFFHGGLVDKASGLSSAQQLIGPYSAPGDPQHCNGNAYPYFFVWESGLFETLQQNLPRIVSETIFQRIRDIVGAKAQSVLTSSTITQAKAMESSAVAMRAPTAEVIIPPAQSPKTLTQADIEEVQQAVESDPLINAEKQHIAQTAIPIAEALIAAQTRTPKAIQVSPLTLLSPEIVAAVAAEEALKAAPVPTNPDIKWNPISLGSLALGAGKVLMRIVQRYATGRNHNFHNTVEEEIFRQFYVANVGWAIWNAMKQDTATAFGGDAEHNVGTSLVAELMKLYESGEDGRRARVTLIGHSAGSIYICNFLAAMSTALQGKAYAGSIRFDVIFLAPAVRIDLLSRTLKSFAQLIRHFRTFDLSDDIEAHEKLVQAANASGAVNDLLGQIYTSSLLYFIAGVLEDDNDDTPIVGMERYFTEQGPFAPGKMPPIDAVAGFRGNQPHRVIVSDTSTVIPAPPVGQRCTSHHHGGFPVDPATLQSICYLLQTADYS